MVSFAGAILVAENGSLLLQRRDDKPTVRSRKMISVFGGLAKDGEDNPLVVAMREVEEETGLSVPYHFYLPLVKFNSAYPDGRKIDASFYALNNVQKNELKITEGSLIEIPILEVGNFMHEIVPTTCFAISIYLQSLGAVKATT